MIASHQSHDFSCPPPAVSRIRRPLGIVINQRQKPQTTRQAPPQLKVGLQTHLTRYIPYKPYILHSLCEVTKQLS